MQLCMRLLGAGHVFDPAIWPAHGDHFPPTMTVGLFLNS